MIKNTRFANVLIFLGVPLHTLDVSFCGSSKCGLLILPTPK